MNKADLERIANVLETESRWAIQVLKDTHDTDARESILLRLKVRAELAFRAIQYAGLEPPTLPDVADGVDQTQKLAYLLSCLNTMLDFVRKHAQPIGKEAAKSAQITKNDLEALLHQVLPDATDFNGFVFMRFPDVYRLFSYSMDRKRRFEILLRTAKPEDVLQALLSFMPEATKKQLLSVDTAT